MRKRIKRLIKFTNDYTNKEEIILRDHLAMERTRLANERTLLSYIRTSLYLILGGIAFLGMKDLTEIRNLGYVSIFLSILILIIGIYRFHHLKKHLRNMYRPLEPKSNSEQSEPEMKK